MNLGKEIGKYYEAPTDEIFEEVRQKAMKLWDVVDADGDKFGYATAKKNCIKDIGNVEDNLMYIIAMFDYGNQQKLAQVLSEEARLAISERMESVKTPEYVNVFKKLHKEQLFKDVLGALMRPEYQEIPSEEMVRIVMGAVGAFAKGEGVNLEWTCLNNHK